MFKLVKNIGMLSLLLSGLLSCTLWASPAAIAALPEFAPETSLYEALPKTGSVFGKVWIPSMKASFPLVQGTAAAQLKKGVGHMWETAMPGESNLCSIAGHRDTFFRKLGVVKVGDRVVIKTDAGRFTYIIEEIRIVDKDDTSIVIPSNEARITVSTCYPFIYKGSAPRCYVLLGYLAKSE